MLSWPKHITSNSPAKKTSFSNLKKKKKVLNSVFEKEKKNPQGNHAIKEKNSLKNR